MAAIKDRDVSPVPPMDEGERRTETFDRVFLTVRTKPSVCASLPQDHPYRQIWNSAACEPFAQTRLVDYEGETELTDHLRSFDRHWIEPIYEYPEVNVALYRLVMDPETGSIVPCSPSDLQIGPFTPAKAYWQLVKAGSRQEEARTVSHPRDVLMTLARMSKNRRASNGRAEVDGVLFVLQRVRLLDFIGPVDDPMSAIELLESCHPAAMAIVQTRQTHVVRDPTSLTETQIQTVVECDMEEAEQIEDTAESIRFIIDLCGSSSPASSDFVCDAVRELEEAQKAKRSRDEPLLIECLLPGEDLRRFHARLDAYAKDDCYEAWNRGAEEPMIIMEQVDEKVVEKKPRRTNRKTSGIHLSTRAGKILNEYLNLRPAEGPDEVVSRVVISCLEPEVQRLKAIGKIMKDLSTNDLALLVSVSEERLWAIFEEILTEA